MPVLLAALVLCTSVSVHDGDTIRCGQERARIEDIDAPELPDSPKCRDVRRSYAWCDYPSRLPSQERGGSLPVEGPRHAGAHWDGQVWPHSRACLGQWSGRRGLSRRFGARQVVAVRGRDFRILQAIISGSDPCRSLGITFHLPGSGHVFRCASTLPNAGKADVPERRLTSADGRKPPFVHPRRRMSVSLNPADLPDSRAKWQEASVGLQVGAPSGLGSDLAQRLDVQ